MIRRIIKINTEKCNGCGLCAKACHEGAIGMIDGKATLLREDYCDGLGDCLPACPTGAISFEEREALAYDEEAVKEAQKKAAAAKSCSGCAGTEAKDLQSSCSGCQTAGQKVVSQLRQWPVQIKLVPANAPFFNGRHLLIAADCTAYAYGNFHNEFMKNKITLIGCTKLDMVDYSEKLTEIIKNNDIRSVTVTRMQVPCCGGMENAVKQALSNSGKEIPLQVVTISPDGKIVE